MERVCNKTHSEEVAAEKGGASGRARAMLSTEDFAKYLDPEAPFDDESTAGLLIPGFAILRAQGPFGPRGRPTDAPQFLGRDGPESAEAGSVGHSEKGHFVLGNGLPLRKSREAEPAAAECGREGFPALLGPRAARSRSRAATTRT